jgi:hypothetical protein
MPYLRIETNVSKDKIPASFGKDMTQIIAKSLGKPESVSLSGIKYTKKECQ